jgi:hypothetical protein
MAGTEIFTVELSGWKGLNTDPNLFDKDPHFVEDCQNVDFDEMGMITKRRGTQKINVTFSGRTNLIYDFQSQQGFKYTDDKHRVVIIAGGYLYVVNEDWTVDAVFPAVNIIHYAVTADNGVCYISNESDSTVPYMLCYG